MNIKKKHFRNTLLVFLFFSAYTSVVIAQETNNSEIESKINLSRHDFLYAGEAKVQDMYIVKGGKVTWEHKGPRVKEYQGEML